ncbi:hypothetical protein IFM89_013138 [Coptis chinensis]|uniref:Uncharacterized protein n=1 Tax=Coptis chinensis TaxID=261450 RepID=A0A835IPW5_9MAGN|nr:hypothetical protein IFM89_013138 [Coptis chinensis]
MEGNTVAYKAAKLVAGLGVNHSFVYSDKPPWQQKLPTVEAGNATEVACDNAVLSIMPQPMAESQRVLIIFRDGLIVLWGLEESKGILLMGGNMLS